VVTQQELISEKEAITAPAAEYEECTVDEVTDFVSEAALSCVDALDDISGKVKGGPIIGLAVGLAAGVAKVAIKDADAEEVVETALETVIPFGEAVTEFSEGNEEAAIISASSDVASIAGGASLSSLFAFAGSALGVAGGATVGAPVLGTVVLGTAGLLVGSVASGYIAEKVMEKNPELVEKIEDGVASVFNAVGIDANALDKKYEAAAARLNIQKDRFFNKMSDAFNFFGSSEEEQALPVAVEVGSQDAAIVRLPKAPDNTI
jgi:hypothetical protein